MKVEIYVVDISIKGDVKGDFCKVDFCKGNFYKEDFCKGDLCKWDFCKGDLSGRFL